MSDNSDRFTYDSAVSAIKKIVKEMKVLWKENEWPAGCVMRVRLINQAANTSPPYRGPKSEEARKVEPKHEHIVVNVRGKVTGTAWLYYENEDGILTFNDTDSHGALIDDREVYRYGVFITGPQDVEKVIKALDDLFLAQDDANREDSEGNTPPSP